MTFIGIDRRPEKPWSAVGAYPRADKPWMALATQCAPGPCCGPVDEGGDFVWFGRPVNTQPTYYFNCPDRSPYPILGDTFTIVATVNHDERTRTIDANGEPIALETLAFVRGSIRQTYRVFDDRIELIGSDGCMAAKLVRVPSGAVEYFNIMTGGRNVGGVPVPLYRIYPEGDSRREDADGRTRVLPAYPEPSGLFGTLDPAFNLFTDNTTLNATWCGDANNSIGTDGFNNESRSLSVTGNVAIVRRNQESASPVVGQDFRSATTFTYNLFPDGPGIGSFEPIPDPRLCYEPFEGPVVDPFDDTQGPGDDGPGPGDDDGVPPGDDDGVPSLRGGPGSPSRFSSNLNGFNPDDERRRTTQGGCCGTPSQP